MNAKELKIIDFSNNNLTDDCANLIGKILSSHGSKRDEIVYINSIRGETTDPDLAFQGIYLFYFIFIIFLKRI